MRRLYNRFFSPARRRRKKAILKDFEEELVDRTHRSFVNQIRRRLMLRSTAVFLFIFMVGSISPNFLVLGDTAGEYPIASADFEEEYADSMLLSIDGFLTKTYAPTEESKGANGIFTITVESGDTLSGIAERYGVSVRDLLVNNNLSRNPILKPGQKMVIANGIIHKVGQKDTADSIAKAYGVEKEKLLATNEILEKELVAGMDIVVTGATRNLPTLSTPQPYRSNTGSIAVGSGSELAQVPYTPNGKLLFPTVGKYTQYFHAGHYAVDIANNQQPAIAAAEAGVVVKAQCGWNGGYGCHVIIQHDDSMKTLYAHMRKLYVTVGEVVQRGQTIGQMGNTGRVYGRTGIHLHFEVIINGVKRNPLAFF